MDLSKIASFELIKSTLFSPERAFEAEKPNSDLNIAAIRMILYCVLAFTLQFLISAGASLFGFGSVGIMSRFAGLPVLFENPLINLAAIVLVVVIFSFVCSAIFFLFARLLGGKGSFVVQTSLFFVGLLSLGLFSLVIFNPFLALVQLLFNNPLLSTLFSISLAIFQIWVLSIAIKVSHGFSIWRGLASMLVPFILLLVGIALFGIYQYFSIRSELCNQFSGESIEGYSLPFFSNC